MNPFGIAAVILGMNLKQWYINNSYSTVGIGIVELGRATHSETIYIRIKFLLKVNFGKDSCINCDKSRGVPVGSKSEAEWVSQLPGQK